MLDCIIDKHCYPCRFSAVKEQCSHCNALEQLCKIVNRARNKTIYIYEDVFQGYKHFKHFFNLSVYYISKGFTACMEYFLELIMAESTI